MNKIINILRFINGRRCAVCGCAIDLMNEIELCSLCYSGWLRECEEVSLNPVSDIKNQMSLIYLTYYRINRDTPSKSMILALKRHNSRDIYNFLAFNLAETLKKHYHQIPRNTIIINVPRSRKAIIKYGFDQAALLAHSVSDMMNLDYFNVLSYKSGRRLIQQKKLTLEDRRLNALNAYYIKKKNIIKFYGKRCILIDDVYTTGATLAACAKLLTDNGAKNVDCAVIAKTVKS